MALLGYSEPKPTLLGIAVRVLCPLILIATTSGMPLRIMFLTPLRRRSWNRYNIVSEADLDDAAHKIEQGAVRAQVGHNLPVVRYDEKAASPVN